MRPLTAKPFRTLRPTFPDDMADALAGRIADWRVTPAWSDESTPRTNAPVRFRYVPCPALGILGRIPFDTATR